MIRSPSTALLIKDETRNVFYELEDPRDVQDRCVIKIYCKEPIYGTYPGHHNPHLANGDLRVRAQPPYSPLIFGLVKTSLHHSGPLILGETFNYSKSLPKRAEGEMLCSIQAFSSVLY